MTQTRYNSKRNSRLNPNVEKMYVNRNKTIDNKNQYDSDEDMTAEFEP